MSIKPVFHSDSYPDGLTKQSFKDQTDINKLLLRHAKAGTLSHLEQYGGQYGDFTDFDFQAAQNRLARATSIFEQLPWETRQDFANDPGRFFEYVGSKTPEELRSELPKLAKRGVQLPNVGNPNVRPPSGGASEPEANVPEQPATPPQGAPSDASTPSESAT